MLCPIPKTTNYLDSAEAAGFKSSLCHCRCPGLSGQPFKKILKEAKSNDGLEAIENDYDEFDTESEEWDEEEKKDELTLADKAAIETEIKELELFRV